MKRIKSLSFYQKCLLIFMLVILLVYIGFIVMATVKNGFVYKGQFLFGSEEDGKKIYSGKIEGVYSKFVVTGNTVELHYDDIIYGPFTTTQDPTAIPEDNAEHGEMKGIEIRWYKEILFRGGVVEDGRTYRFYDEDGNEVKSEQDSSDGGNMPSASTIYELTNKIRWKADGVSFIESFFIYVLIIYILNTVHILYADELFRFNLIFQIRNPQDAEPSEYEMFGRYFAWILCAVIPLILFIVGLNF